MRFENDGNGGNTANVEEVIALASNLPTWCPLILANVLRVAEVSTSTSYQ